MNVQHSPDENGWTLSYKEPSGICTTAFETQKQYTGWVDVVGDHPANLFFWFVEAREPTDHLTIWLSGGPGASSLGGLFTGVGPCEVFATGRESYETRARQWGWDRASNLLFIDQPSQVGFSYDIPSNGTLLADYSKVEIPSVSEGSFRMTNGTFSTGNKNNIANTTENAAVGMYEVLQGFFNTFPEYQKLAQNLHIFGQSYGARSATSLAEYILEQNNRISQHVLDPDLNLNIQVKSLGIVSGAVDLLADVETKTDFLTDKTYKNYNFVRDVIMENQDVVLKALAYVQTSEDPVAKTVREFIKPVWKGWDTLAGRISKEDTLGTTNIIDGLFDVGAVFVAELLERLFNKQCVVKANMCKKAALANDPKGAGNRPGVNAICAEAVYRCHITEHLFTFTGKHSGNIAAPILGSASGKLYTEYLNQPQVLQALGSPVNYTDFNRGVWMRFLETGDLARPTMVSKIASLVDRGVRVGFLYGDRDYICQWHGGEKTSKRVAEEAKSYLALRFDEAGYADIFVNDTYRGGHVRQAGDLSFSRIFQAGHSVPVHQPETAFQVFERIISGKSVSTGQYANLSNFTTKGRKDSHHRDYLPSLPSSSLCFMRDWEGTCKDELAESKNASVRNGILFPNASEADAFAAQYYVSNSTQNTTTNPMTGVYTSPNVLNATRQ